MKLTIEPFRMDSEDATFRKIFEELFELTEARALSAASGETCDIHLMMEVGDLYTVLTNWCEWAGISPQACIDLANTKNIIRGRYDTIE